eukprot:GFUD01037887.1.p1 GENE.GFUD01037887.1~~GFUD01037887.1.p1  ORF type:complete len:272 (-),score=66.15 GFUD01037887.1:209-1024(-)
MTSFFADIPAFTSWLETKTEAELKSKLFRADPRARLTGPKPALVRRLVESTRHLGQERQETIFPELRRRRQDHLARISTTRQPGGRVRPAQARQSADREAPAREQHHRPGAGGLRQVGSLAAITRPVPMFHTARPAIEPRTPPPVTHNQHQEARDLTPFLRFPGNLAAAGRTPEQILRETLEAQASLIIQSFSQAASRPRHNSMSRMGAAAMRSSPEPSRARAASTSSAEKRGPEVSLEDKYQDKLECKICYGSLSLGLQPGGEGRNVGEV